MLKQGDFVMMQFGHNDEGPANDNFRARGSINLRTAVALLP
jgi:hypothetical protein